MIAAVQSGQVDATIAIASQAKPLAASGQAHIIGWVGDIVPYQITALFTTDKMIAQHADLLHRFARAYQKGVADYREAFLRLDAPGKPIVDAKTDAVMPLIEKYVFTGDPHAREKILAGVGYYDAGGALDVADVERAIALVQGAGPGEGRRRRDRGDRHAVPADAMSDGLRLVLRGVCHAYRDLSVLQDIDLVAEPGEVMVLVGPSGCGKSTLLGIMGGMLAPSAGTVRVEGEVADDCLNPLTYVFQDFALLPWRSVAGNVSLVLEQRAVARRARTRVSPRCWR